jgi:hypothetical protein
VSSSPNSRNVADPNERNEFWDLAGAFRDDIHKKPTESDYVLYADYVFDPRHWEQCFVHFIVWDRKGEWVIMDRQNSHHPDYQRAKPSSPEGCDRLLVKHLMDSLR